MAKCKENVNDNNTRDSSCRLLIFRLFWRGLRGCQSLHTDCRSAYDARDRFGGSDRNGLSDDKSWNDVKNGRVSDL